MVFALASFCNLLTLQVGCAILAVVFIAIGVLVLGVNVFDYKQHVLNDWPADLVLVLIFVVLMIVAGIIIFMSAYNESRTLCFAALTCIGIITLYWLVLTILSFVNDPSFVRKVCVEFRCGESFWLAKLNYRENIGERYYTSAPGLSSTTEENYETDYIDDRTTKIVNEPSETVSSSSTELSPSAEPPESPDEPRPEPYTPDSNSTTISTKPTVPITTETNETSRSPNQPSNTTSDVPPESNGTLANVTDIDGEAGGRKRHLINGLSLVVDDDDFGGDDFDNHDNENDDGNHNKIEHDDEEHVIKKHDDTKLINSETENGRFVFGAAFAGAIIFAVVNLVFFIFSVIVLWSYAQELKFNNYYYYDTPTYR